MREITIDEVINFIREKGYIYDYQILQELKKIPRPKKTPKQATKERSDMYKRLSNL